MKLILRHWGGSAKQHIWPRLSVLGGCFLLGVFLGQEVSCRAMDSCANELSRYLADYFSLRETPEISLHALVANLVVYLRYPLLAFLFGFASAGVVLIPILTAAFGFFLSYSVSCFALALGECGIWLALAILGLRCLVTLPCYLLLAAPAMRTSESLLRLSMGKGTPKNAVHCGASGWLRLLIVTGVLFVGALLELLISPKLLGFALAQIFP